MRRAWIIGIVVSAVALSLTWIASDFRLFQLANVAALAVAMLGLNILTGYNGQISLGHGAFMGLGGYAGAILVRDHGLPYPLVIVAAFVLCAVVGAIVGIPALRLPGTSLALITLALAVAFPQILKKFDSVTGGVQGIGTPPDRQLNSPWSDFSNDQYRYLFCAVVAILLFWLAWNIVRGRWGLAMMSVRDNPLSAASMGVNLASTKVVTFAISAGYAGVGGAMQGILVGYISPESISLTISIALLTGIVIGGLGTVAGAVIGGVFVWFLPYYSNEISQAAPGAVYGVIIILIMILAPGGIMGLLRRGGARLARRRGVSGDELATIEAHADFPTQVDEPTPMATGI